MLQGSLDNFALDEVLGLLSSTSKTGRLRLKGDRGEGALTIYAGQLVDATASYDSNGSAPEDVIFELLRYVDGSFTFDASEVEATESTRDINEVLVSAEGRLADWRTIESVVPSLSHMVTPAASLPAEEVTINRSEWTTLRIIAAGCPASLVCDELGLGEVEGSRQIKGLAERGLVSVGPPETTAPSPRGVDALTGSPARDPFARRAIDTGSVTEDPISAAARTTADEPLASIDEEGAFAEGSYDEGFMPAPPEPTSARPPMPNAPSVEDLQDLANPLDGGDMPPAPPPVPMMDEPALVGGNGNGTAEDRDAETKPGGLLMRYLKSDD